MQKRKAETKNEQCVSKQQCTVSTAQQLRNEAREKIIAERKERNRRSAAASRKRKDDEIIQLREQVKQLTESNNALMKIVMQLPQSQLQGINHQTAVMTQNPDKFHSTTPLPTTMNMSPVSSIVEDDSNDSNSGFSVVSESDHDDDISTNNNSTFSTSTTISSSLLSNFTFSPNSSEPAVFQ